MPTSPLVPIDPPAPPRRIQSLEVGFGLIREIESSPDGLSLKDVSARAGMPRSKAHLYLSTFLGINLLSRDAAGIYRLGPYALQMGMAALRHSNVVDVADETLRELQERTGHTVHLSVWGNLGPTIVRKLDGNLRIPMSIQVGYVLPLLGSATGRVFLAFEREARSRPVLEREKPGIDRTRGEAAELIAHVTACGFASSSSHMYEGFAALSTPVWDHRGELCAALTLLNVAASIDLDIRGETARLLKRGADQISTRLGRT
jgi:DNA-binding IclR family transcriptional regulator